MRQTFALHIAVFGNVLRRMFASRLAGFFNILVIGIALSLPAGLYALLQNAQFLVTELTGTAQISLFLNLETRPDDVERLRKQLAQHPALASIEFIPRAQALEQLKRSTGLADVIGGMNQNPLPDAFIVFPRHSDAKSLEMLRSELQKLPRIEYAQLDSAWVYKLEALFKFTRLAVLILAILLSLALIAITFNTIRLQILTQRDEIEVTKLIGATNAFIRRPFLYFGAMQGLLGGIAAYLIINLGLMLLNRQLHSLAQLYGSQFSLHSLSSGDSLSLLMFSVYLGWLGARLSVARHLSQIEPR